MDSGTDGKYKYNLHLQMGTCVLCDQHGTMDVEHLGFTDEERDELTEESRQRILNKMTREWANEYVNSYWQSVS